MALGGHALHARNVIERFQKIGQIGQNVRTNAFRNAYGIGALERFANNRGIEGPAACFKRGRERNMGGHNEIQVQIGRLVFLDYRLDAFKAAYHAHFVQVSHNRRRAMLEHRFCERPNSQV